MDSSHTGLSVIHGGDLSAAERQFGAPPPAGWLDLSTGINPCPYPVPDLAPEVWHRLPDPRALDRLLSAARAYYRVPDDAAITAAAGTQQLIQLLPRLVPGMRVAIAEPTYGEHAVAWRRAGRVLVTEAARADVAVLVNPNNPDGRIARDLPAAPTVIIDEAFADVTPEASAVSETSESRAIILKSFGKFFGLAGLRLGFCISSRDFAEELAAELGPWAVSGPALEIGTRALADADWIAATRRHLVQGRERLDAVLSGAGLQIIGGTDLFRLTSHPEAHAIYDHLGRAGILARPFADHSEWLRFGLPGTDQDFARLEAALGGYARSRR